MRSIRTLLVLAVPFVMTSCGPTQTLVVRFDDLRSDFIVLEASLEQGDAAGIDWQKQAPETSRPAVRGTSDRRNAKIFTENQGCSFAKVYRDSVRSSGV